MIQLNSVRQKYAVAAALLVAIGLSACDRGSRDADKESDSHDLLDGQVGVNGQLTGKLLTTKGAQFESIDLSSGQLTTFSADAVEQMVSSTQSFTVSDPANFLSPSQYSDDSRYVQVYEKCHDRSSEGVDNDSCYAIYDATHTPVASGVLPRVELKGEAKLARSGERFAVVETGLFDNGDESLMRVHNVQSGQLELALKIDISSHNDRSGMPAIEWGLDDELIYSNPASNPPRIVITEPGEADVDRGINLPSQYSGRIQRLHLSPDGAKLLLQYQRSGSDSSSFPMILELATLKLTKPAVAETDVDLLPLGDNQSRQANSIETRGWSEDGEWIFVAYENYNTSAVYWQDKNTGVQVAQIPTSGAWQLSAVPAVANAAVLSPVNTVSTQGVISPLRYVDGKGDMQFVSGDDRHWPIGVK